MVQGRSQQLRTLSQPSLHGLAQHGEQYFPELIVVVTSFCEGMDGLHGVGCESGPLESTAAEVMQPL